jgi:GNAT superfamily N-acetyltransferase
MATKAEAFLDAPEAPTSAPKASEYTGISAESFLDTPDESAPLAPASQTPGSMVPITSAGPMQDAVSFLDAPSNEPLVAVDRSGRPLDPAKAGFAPEGTDPNSPANRWNADTSPYKVTSGGLELDPLRYSAGVSNAYNDGLLDQSTYEKLTANAPKIEEAARKRRDLELSAGSSPEGKALLQGLGRGGAVTLGFTGGAALPGLAGLPGGPLALVTGAAGGIVGGYAAGKAYDATYKALADNDAEFNSYLSASEARPGYNALGELASIAVTAPLAPLNLVKGIQLVRETKGALEAAKFAGKVIGIGAGTGAATDVAWKLGDQALARFASGDDTPEGPTFQGALQSAAMGALLSGLTVQNKRYELSDIQGLVGRSQAGEKLSPMDQEAVTTALRVAESVRGEFPNARPIDLSMRQTSFMGKPEASAAKVTMGEGGVESRGSRVEALPGEPPAGGVQGVGGQVPSVAGQQLPALAPLPLENIPTVSLGAFTMDRNNSAPANTPSGVIAMPGRAALPEATEQDILKKQSAYTEQKRDNAYIISSDKDLGDLPEYQLSTRRTPFGMEVEWAKVHPDLRGKGLGVELYKKAINDAASRGLDLVSDVSVTVDAVRVYQALERQGYSVAYNPNTKEVVNPGGQKTVVSIDKNPVVRVKPQSRAEAFLDDEAAPVTPPAPTISDLNPDLYPPVETPISKLTLSEDVPNFKAEASKATGVVQGNQLQGTYRRLGTPAIIVWQRNNGALEVISGRHRFDLAKRTGEKTIPAQIVRESEGFTTQDAMTLDAEGNIRDGQGTVQDYANYFRNSSITEAQAVERSLLQRAPGRSGWALGRSGSNDLYAAYSAGRISEAKAVAIAQAAPGDEESQRAGLAQAKTPSMTPEALGTLVSMVKYSKAQGTQEDLFGTSDAGINEALRLVKLANSKADEIQDQITAVNAAAKRPEAAAKLGVNVSDPDGILKRVSELRIKAEQYRKFYLYPEIRAELTGAFTPPAQTQAAPPSATPAPNIATNGPGNLFGPTDMPFSLAGQVETGPTPAEVAAAEAERLAQEEADRNQGDMFAGGFGGNADYGPQGNGGSAAEAGPSVPDNAAMVTRGPGWEMPEILGATDRVLPIEVPELIRWFREATGFSPSLRRSRRALGTFTGIGKGRIWIRTDLFSNPQSVAMTLAHEIGHWIDYLPDESLKRGNILGRLGSLLSYLKQTMPLGGSPSPVAGGSGPAPTAKERRKIADAALDDLRKSLGEVIVKVMVEEPIFRELGISPEDVKSLFGLNAREELPALYDWFAKQDGATKKSIVKKAMAGIVDERIKQFGKQEQIGTRMVEKEVMTAGRAPTAEEIKQAIVQAMRQEYRKRNLASNTLIRDELMELSQWWKPFDVVRSPASYVSYRNSSKELYADAISVLFNSPADLELRAPSFWEAFWLNVERKPEIAEAILGIQTFLAKGPEAVNVARLGQQKEGYAKAREIVKRRAASMKAWSQSPMRLWERMKDTYYFYASPAIELMHAKRAAGIPLKQEDRMDWLFEEMPLANSSVQADLMEITATVTPLLQAVGLTDDDLGIYLENYRIANERVEVEKQLGKASEQESEVVVTGRTVMANPDGKYPAMAQALLDQQRSEMSPEAWKALQAAAQAFHDKIFSVVEDAVDAGIISRETFDTLLVPNRDVYATFTPLKYADRYVPAAIVRQVGTLDQVANPFTQTVLKMVAMRRAAQSNKAKATFFGWMQDSFPGLIKAAEMRWDGRRNVPVKTNDVGWSTVNYRVDGKLRAVHLPERYAAMFEAMSPAHQDGLTQALSMAWNSLAYPLIIKYNPSFQLALSPMRDLLRTMRNAPNKTRGRLLGEMAYQVALAALQPQGRAALATTAGGVIGQAVGSIGGFVAGPAAALAAGQVGSYVGAAAGMAVGKILAMIPLQVGSSPIVDRITGGSDALLQEMLINGAVVGPHESFYVTPDGEGALGDILRQFNMLPAEDQPAFTRKWFMRPVMEYLRAVQFAGQIMEGLPKVAGYKVLAKDLGWGGREAGAYVRNYLGVPNYMKKGNSISTPGVLFPFINITMRSWESSMKLLAGREKGRKSQADYILSYILAGGFLTTVMMVLAREGMFGEELQKLTSKIPERDVYAYHSVPIGSTTTGDYGGKTAYVRWPVDEVDRALNGMVYYGLTATIRKSKGEATGLGLGNIVAVAGSETPSLNPFLSLPAKWLTYAAGGNPLDEQRGRPILTDDEQKAGGWPAVRRLLIHSSDKIGLSNFLRYDEKSDTVAEFALSSTAPINRFLKISDAGASELSRDEIAGEEKAISQVRVNLSDDVRTATKEYAWLQKLDTLRTPQQTLRYMILKQWYGSIYRPQIEALRSSVERGNLDAGARAISTINGITDGMKRAWARQK